MPVPGSDQTVPRAEALAIYVALCKLVHAKGRIVIKSDCLNVVLHIKLLQAGMRVSSSWAHSDVWRWISELPLVMAQHEGGHQVFVQWVKAHLSENAVAQGRISREDFEGNAEADTLAKAGAALGAPPKSERARYLLLVRRTVQMQATCVARWLLRCKRMKVAPEEEDPADGGVAAGDQPAEAVVPAPRSAETLAPSYPWQVDDEGSTRHDFGKGPAKWFFPRVSNKVDGYDTTVKAPRHMVPGLLWYYSTMRWKPPGDGDVVGTCWAELALDFYAVTGVVPRTDKVNPATVGEMGEAMRTLSERLQSLHTLGIFPGRQATKSLKICREVTQANPSGVTWRARFLAHRYVLDWMAARVVTVVGCADFMNAQGQQVGFWREKIPDSPACKPLWAPLYKDTVLVVPGNAVLNHAHVMRRLSVKTPVVAVQPHPPPQAASSSAGDEVIDVGRKGSAALRARGSEMREEEFQRLLAMSRKPHTIQLPQPVHIGDRRVDGDALKCMELRCSVCGSVSVWRKRRDFLVQECDADNPSIIRLRQTKAR